MRSEALNPAGRRVPSRQAGACFPSRPTPHASRPKAIPSPLAPHPSRPKASQTGFTLVELLAVLAIVAIMAVAAVLSIDLAGPGARLDEEARRFVTLTELLCEEAVLESTELGVRLADAGYAFVRRTGDGWEDRTDRLYRPHAFPDLLRIELTVEGHPVVLEEIEEPPIICWSSGELTAFELRMELPETPALTVTADVLGEVEIAR